jgi:hypothetical protein
MPLQQDLLDIEERLWTGGADAYRKHVDTECLIAFTQMAGVMTREEVAASVEAGPRWQDLDLHAEGMVRPADDVAVLTYWASAVRGQGERYRALVSSAYVRRDGRWKLTFHQQTPLEG